MWQWFVALVLILLGVISLLVNAQVLSGSPLGYALPIILILIGGLILLSVRKASQPLQTTTDSEPLNDATRLTVTFRHGVGKLHLRAEPDAALLFAGSWTGGVDKKITRDNVAAALELTTPPELWETLDSPRARAVDWQLSLNPSIPLTIRYEGGAAQARMDLEQTHLTLLELNSGASAVDVILPKPTGVLEVFVRAPSAPITLRILPGVAAAIRTRTPYPLPAIDETRFPKHSNGIYQSDTYPHASDRIDITIEGGSAFIRIR